MSREAEKSKEKFEQMNSETSTTKRKMGRKGASIDKSYNQATTFAI